jgi:UDP-N-acetylmuramate--alanine ligase
VRAILPRVDRKTITYGLSSDADVAAIDVRVEGFRSTYTAMRDGAVLGPIELALPGRHSIYNSLAAVAVGLELDVPFREIARGLAGFRGVDRRLQRRGSVNGATVLDDYGHHPTEIAATLAAVREGFGARTLVVFQPHRYSRTRALLEEFGCAFYLADRVIVTDIYAAGEEPVNGLNGASVADALVRHGHPWVRYQPDFERIAGLLRDALRPGDIVLTLGAGDVWKVGERLVRDAQKKRKTGAKGARTDR